LARHAVLLDACVLVPIALADTLLRIAERELYRPLWSARIVAEAAAAAICEIVEPLHIEVIHPDDFLLDQLDLAPRVVLDVLRDQAAHTRRPALTPVDLIARLARAGAPRFANEASRLL
jgi:hypothetical protein